MDRAEIWCVVKDQLDVYTSQGWDAYARAHPFSVSRERQEGLR